MISVDMKCVDCISEESLPELFEPVDVLVVGGTAACVAAASEAARHGASVCLLAPRPYLGEELCDTNMYTELPRYGRSKDPLLAAISRSPKMLERLPPTVAFSYALDGAVNENYPDSSERPVLNDHRVKLFGKGNGIEVNSDATVEIVLSDGVQKLDKVTLMMFQNGHSKVEKMTVDVRQPDGTWSRAGEVFNGDIDNVHTRPAMPLSVSLNGVEASSLRVFIGKLPVEPRMLLGEICIVTTSAAEALAKRPDPVMAPYPMTVKRELESALLDSGVRFLYGVQVADVLQGAGGTLAGLVVVDRSGAQHVRCKAVIDGTEHGLVARLAGAAFRAAPVKEQELVRYVIGGAGIEPAEGKVEQLPWPLQITGGCGMMPAQQPVWKYTFREKLGALGIRDMMALENKTRDLVWNRQIVELTGRFAYTAGQRILGKSACDAVIPAKDVAVDCMRPRGLDNVFMLGRHGDVCQALCIRLQDVDESLALGRKIGAFAATLRQGALPEIGRRALVSHGRRVRLSSMPHRFNGHPVMFHGQGLPVLGTYDVLVVGGGTGGGPAAIGAARQGAKTLLVEYLNDFGGTCTLGSINNYCFGNVCGFTTEMDNGIGHDVKPWESRSWSRVLKSDWMRRQILDAGGEIWTSTMVFGAVMEGHELKGIAVATPFGPGVIYAKTVIDGTGNADVAAAAGAACMDQDEELGVQGVGLSPVRMGDDYVNTDYLFHDDSDVIDAWRSFVLGRERYKSAADINPIIGTRERRRIVGDEIVMPMDIYNKRTFPDTICISRSNFDTHGYTCHPLFFALGPDSERIEAEVPFRALLPKGIENLEVIGLAISGHRDTMPILRMQPDVQNHGYAAGVAAAMAAQDCVNVRYISVKALQRHLVEIGNLPERVLKARDSYPLAEDVVRDAVDTLSYDHRKLSVIMASMDMATPMMESVCKAGDESERGYLCALILALYGNDAGKGTLCKALASTASWDEGWNFRGMGQFGPSSSKVDSLIVALGAIQARESLGDIVRLTGQLTVESHFSHFRAVSLALSAMGGEAEAKALAGVLSLRGMAGHDQPLDSNPRDFAAMANPDWRRSEELREIFLGVALYRCGDWQGIGADVLKRYAHDGRGIYARHATYVLKH